MIPESLVGLSGCMMTPALRYWRRTTFVQLMPLVWGTLSWKGLWSNIVGSWVSKTETHRKHRHVYKLKVPKECFICVCFPLYTTNVSLGNKGMKPLNMTKSISPSLISKVQVKISLTINQTWLDLGKQTSAGENVPWNSQGLRGLRRETTPGRRLCSAHTHPQALHPGWVMGKRLRLKHILTKCTLSIWKTKIKRQIIPLIKNVFIV